MPSIEDRFPLNTPGKFYVDWTCIYCDLCVETAPSVFKEYKPEGNAYVFSQPSSKEEFDLAMESVEGCPTNSIGFDGDLFDWTQIPPHRLLGQGESPSNDRHKRWLFAL